MVRVVPVRKDQEDLAHSGRSRRMGRAMGALEENGRAEDLAGKCVLVAEDDFILAREVCDDLKSHGALVLGPAPTVHYANLIIGKRHMDGAILDVKLFGEDVYALVDLLNARGVPVVFATACGPDEIDARYRDIEILPKPIDFGRLRRRIAAFRPVPISPSRPAAQAQPSHRGPDRPPTITATPLGDRERWSRLLLGAIQQKMP